MPREEFTTEVMLNILNPSETFTPKYVGGEILEISAKSARVKTYQLTQTECDQLVKQRHVAKFEFQASFLPRPLKIKADIFWAKYVIVDRTELPYCDLGFNLRPIAEQDQELFDAFLANWEARPV